MSDFDAIWAASVLMRSGDILIDGDGDPVDLARLFVTLVGCAAVTEAVRTRAVEVPYPPRSLAEVQVLTWMEDANGRRLRTFNAGAFKVWVRPHEDDEAHAAFARRLADAAQQIVRES